MSKLSKLFAGLMLFTLLTGCGDKAVKQANQSSQPVSYAPVSKQVRFVESVNASESLFEAWGQGASVASAFTDAKRAALWSLLYSGERALLGTTAAKEAFKPFSARYYKNVSDAVRYESKPLSKKKRDGQTLIKLRITLDVAQISQHLVNDGVIQDTQSLNDQIGLPTIVVLNPNKEDEVSVTTIEGYLINQGFSLASKKATDKVNRLTGKVAALTGQLDPMYVLASKTGADVYIEVHSKVKKLLKHGMATHQASMVLKAYESASGRLVATASGYSANRANTSPSALQQEAGNEAASQMVQLLNRSWQKQAKNGRIFKLVVSLEPDQAQSQDDDFYQTLRFLKPVSIKRLQAGQRSVSYLVKMKGINSAMDLYLAIKNRYIGTGQIKRELDVGSLLLLRLDASDGEMLLD